MGQIFAGQSCKVEKGRCLAARPGGQQGDRDSEAARRRGHPPPPFKRETGGAGGRSAGNSEHFARNGFSERRGAAR